MVYIMDFFYPILAPCIIQHKETKDFLNKDVVLKQQDKIPIKNRPHGQAISTYFICFLIMQGIMATKINKIDCSMAFVMKKLYAQGSFKFSTRK